MLNSLTGLFHAPRSRETGKIRSARARKGSRRQRGDSLTLQQLESRLALTLNAVAVPIDGGTFAWNILIDDTVDAAGAGRDAYLQASASEGIFLLADNSSYVDEKNLSNAYLFPNPDGTETGRVLSTFYVGTGTTDSFSATLTNGITQPGPGKYGFPLQSRTVKASGTVLIDTNPTSKQATTTNASSSVAINGSTASLLVGMGVQGNNIAPGTTITAIDAAASTITLSANATGDGPSTLTFTGNNAVSLQFTAYPDTIGVQLGFDADAWKAAGYGTPTAKINLGAIEFSLVKADGTPVTVTTFNATASEYFRPLGTVNDSPQSFTLTAGQNVNQRLVCDLTPTYSTVNINSPLLSTMGSDADPGYFAGSVSLDATTVNINQKTTGVRDITIGRQSTPLSPTAQFVNVNAEFASATRFRMSLASIDAEHALLAVSQAGSLTAGISMTFTGDNADVQFLGAVSAPQHSYFLRAVGSADQYQFTTRSPATGIQAGTIAGGTVAMTLGQPAGGTVDIRTNIDNFRFDSGTGSDSVPLAYTINVEEQDGLTVDAVGSSSAPISIRSGVAAGTGDLTILGSAVRTVSDLSLSTPGTLTLNGAVSTGDGDVRLSAASLAISTNITAGGNRSVSLNSAAGTASIGALVQAGGTVKESVRVATTGTITLSGLQTVDGIAVSAGDRVLVKNQTTASQNGIYIVAVGAWTRASDANTANLLVPGFVTFAAEGTQKGGWTFRNAATPIVGSTGLSFVPTTATVVFNPVRLATTGENLSLDGIGQTIDGQTVVAGDRILAKNQTDPSDNGIYLASAGAWTRASDADTVAELRSGAYAFVTSGTANGGNGFALSNDAVEVGTTPLTFQPFLVASPRTNVWSPANVLANADVATTNNIVLSGLQPIDGVLLTAGTRVLVKNQSNAAENGLYVAAVSSWSRAIDADTAAELPGATTVFVKNGTQNKNTAWNIDNSITETATTVKDSAVVSGLFSTQALSVGMLVVGAGIPANTTIAAINADGHSVRLSANATLPGTNTAVSFLSTSAIMLGTSPIRFLPVGGDVAVTSATDITGASRLVGSTAVLTAGTAGKSGLINAFTNAGELIASSLGSITLDNAAPVELTNVRTTVAGSITATSKGTLTATLVSATGTTGTPALPGNVSLTSQFGDVVAGNVSSTFGDISLVASNANVLMTTGTPTPANVSAQAGNVVVTADFGKILVDGRVQAQGVSSDVTLSSANGTIEFTDLANVSATDQLTISVPKGTPTVATNAQLAAAALNYTAQFGKSSEPPASLGSYGTVTLTRTDAGDIDYTVPGSLTVAGASTINGSISFKAAALTVTGAIAPNGTAKDVSLTADSGDILIDNTITSGRNLTLSAEQGSIGGTGGIATAKLNVPGDITLRALSSAQLTTRAGGLNATLTGANAVLVVTEDDSLDIKSVAFDGTGATATLTVGLPALGGVAKVGLISAGTTGTVTINAYSNILENTVDAAADIVAQTLFLTSITGSIDLDTDVAVLSATTQQAGKSLSIRDVGTGASGGLELKSIVAAGTVSVTSVGAILATSVTNSGAVSLTTTGVDADILLGSVVATGNTATLHAARSILEVTVGDTLADLVAAGAVLTADTGSINVQTNVDSLAATATTVGSSITVSDDNALSIGVASQGINGQTVSITTGALGGNGAMTQSQSVVATQGLTVTNLGNAGAVTLGNAANDVASVAITNTGRAVTYTDKNGFDIATAGIVGSTVALTAAGNVTQTGAIAATTLTVTNSAGTVVLGNAANNADSIALSNTGRAITYTDSNGFDIAAAGISGSPVTLTAAGIVTQTGAITAASLAVTNTAGTVTLTNAKNDVGSLAISNTGRAIAYTDSNGFDIAAAGIVGSPVTLTAGGNLTQTGAITAASLAVTSSAGTVTLGNASNDVASVAITNAGRAITYTDKNGFDIAAAGIVGSPVTLTAGGNVTQTGAVTAASLAVTNSAGTVTLTNAKNDVSSLAISNTGRAIAYTDSNGFDIAAAGIVGSPVTLTAAGNVTQTGAITAASLAVTSSAGTVTLGNASNDVASVAITNTGRAVNYTDKNGFDVAGIAGSVVTLTAAGNVTQSAAITATSLAVTNTTGSVTLDNAGNNVGTLGTVSNPGGDVTFVNAGTFTTTAITAGTVAVGDGNILLKSVNGSINVNGDLTAQNDRVTLDARNGTFTLANGITIDAYMLVYYVATPPNFGVGTTIPSIVAANGNLTIDSLTPVTFGGYTTEGDITIIGTTVTISGLLKTTGTGKTVAITATAGDIAFISAGAIDNAVGLSGTTTLSAAAGTITGSSSSAVSGFITTLTVGQALSFAGPITATTLTATGASTGISLTGTNSLGTVAVTKGSNVVINDSTGALILGAIGATGSITVTAAGAVSQSGAISGGALSVNAAGNAITLNTQNNTVTSFASTNGAGSVTFKDTAGTLVLAGITGGTVTIDAAGAVTQTAAINAGAFTVNAAGNAVTLNTQNNAVTSFASSNGAGSVVFKDTAGGLTLAGITGGTVTITAAGAVDQTAAVSAGAFTVNGNGSAISLNTQNNAVTSFASSNAAGTVLFNDTAGGLILAGITGGTVTLGAAGAVTQTAALNAGALTVNGNGSAISLNTQNNAVTNFAASNGAGSISFADTSGDLSLGNITSGSLSIAAAGAVTINQTQVVASGNVIITTQAGGGLSVIGPQPGGLLSSSTQITLSGVQGPIVLVNGGQIVAPTIIGNGQNVDVGGTITTTDDLNAAVAAVNTLPIISGSTYEIVVGSNLTLSQTLTINRPVSLHGNGTPYVLTAGSGVTNGLVLNPTASGSRISSLAFSGFGGTAIQLNAAQNVAISGIAVTGNWTGVGTGLGITGRSTGTTVQGSTFTNNPFAIRLTSATGVTIGGTAAGLRNTISGSTRAGVFATGFGTGSSVIRTVFLRTLPTPVQYNLRSSRNLRVVR